MSKETEIMNYEEFEARFLPKLHRSKIKGNEETEIDPKKIVEKWIKILFSDEN